MNLFQLGDPPAEGGPIAQSPVVGPFEWEMFLSSELHPEEESHLVDRLSCQELPEADPWGLDQLLQGEQVSYASYVLSYAVQRSLLET